VARKLPPERSVFRTGIGGRWNADELFAWRRLVSNPRAFLATQAPVYFQALRIGIPRTLSLCSPAAERDVSIGLHHNFLDLP
jgi:hypothetical protein